MWLATLSLMLLGTAPKCESPERHDYAAGGFKVRVESSSCSTDSGSDYNKNDIFDCSSNSCRGVCGSEADGMTFEQILQFERDHRPFFLFVFRAGNGHYAHYIEVSGGQCRFSVGLGDPEEGGTAAADAPAWRLVKPPARPATKGPFKIEKKGNQLVLVEPLTFPGDSQAEAGWRAGFLEIELRPSRSGWSYVKARHRSYKEVFGEDG